jgi:CubicO group peptidase (beta-lactamase class C family)
MSSPAAEVSEPLTHEGIESLRRECGVPALAAAVAWPGETATIWVSGRRASGADIPVGTDDCWHWGSISKSLTAALVARLVESGAIRWDDTVGELLKTIGPGMRDVYKPVTFRHLLSHRAGLPDNIPLLQFAKFANMSRNVCKDRRAYAKIALSMPPLGPMGSAFLYSNSGYVIAGAMLEAKLGHSWEHLLRTHVFRPLKLSTAGFGAPGEEDRLVHPAGHTYSHDLKIHLSRRVESELADNPQVLGPAGRVHMSLADMLEFLATHRDGSDFLLPETQRILRTPPFGGRYAMGWVNVQNGALWHNGSNTLWYAEVLFEPAWGACVAAVANDARPETQTVVHQALLRAAKSQGRDMHTIH